MAPQASPNALKAADHMFMLATKTETMKLARGFRIFSQNHVKAPQMASMAGLRKL
jgi:hypothetical protein